jgi:16S rRNA (guanine(1405)-N(7))-methyltransferase
MAYPQPESLMAQVMSNPKYKNITEDLVLRLCQEAIAAGLAGKPAVKYVRNKLYQVGGAYFKKSIDYAGALQDLTNLPMSLHADLTKEYCRNLIERHASTAERLPIMEAFFHTCLASIAPVESVLDLACGLNPLAMPWMPLKERAHYFACDIYTNLLGLINAFFNHFSRSGWAKPCDLIGHIPSEQTQVAFLLKSIPCLEQMDKTIISRLLDTVQAEHILVSFPVHSLAGRQKGMAAFYRDHFFDLVAERTWHLQEFSFKTELAFLVSK